LIDRYDELLRDVEWYLTRTAKVDDPQPYYRLQTIGGIGKILALVLLTMCAVSQVDREQYASTSAAGSCCHSST
jgi:hypothetical protein